jgi:PIN domain nuclease of toxin-antitoxin system
VPVRIEHILALEGMPLHHKDPFDRLLVAQATVEKLVLISKDREIVQYGIPTFWA